MNLLTLAEVSDRIKSGEWRGTLAQATKPRAATREEIVATLEALEAKLAPVTYGDKVVLPCGQTIETALAFVALWKKGACCVPVGGKDTGAEKIARIGADCNAKFSFDPETGTLAPLEAYTAEAPRIAFRTPPKVSGSDLALLIYSSGSTGKPKGIMLTHNNVMAALQAITRYLELGPQDRILCVSPLSFDYGLYQVLFSFASHCEVVLFDEPMNPIGLAKAMNRWEISTLPVVPVIGASLEKTLKALKMKVPSLRKVTNTGGHLGVTVIQGLLALMPELRIYCMYGLTESKRALYLPPEDLHRKLGSVGIPMPGLEAKVFIEDESGLREAAPDEIGELHVRGASVMQGYYAADAGAGARLVPGKYRDDNWLATGDLFSRDAEGYFYFRGRAKDLVKQGGFCLYPLEIEELVAKCEHIELAACVGKTIDTGEEIARLFIKPVNDTPEVRKVIEDWLKHAIDPDYRPRDVRFLVDMPVNGNGKVDKKQLQGV